MAIELKFSEGKELLFKNFCKRNGMTPEQAAGRGVEDAVQMEALDALRRLIAKDAIPLDILAESSEGVA